MESRRLAAMVRRTGETQTRRGTFAGALATPTVPALLSRGDEVQAKKGNKKGKKKGKNVQKCRPTQIPQLSCQEACPGNCADCLHRKADSILCGSGFSAGLKPCSSDNDCIGVKFNDTHLPYCLTRVELRVNGVVDNIRDGTGFCSEVLACSAV